VSPDRLTFVLTLRSEASSIPAGRRLAGLLKVALRAFGFRCVEVREAPAGGCEGQDTGPAGTSACSPADPGPDPGRIDP
jgi:hypothetical protein